MQQQIFRRNVGDSNLQFNRLLFPVRYSVKSDENDSEGIAIEFKKKENEEWKPEINGTVPGWVYTYAKEIAQIIKENEALEEPVTA